MAAPLRPLARGRWRCRCSPCRARGVVVAGADRRGRRCLGPNGARTGGPNGPERAAAAASQARGCLGRRRDSVPEEVANIPGILVRLRHVDEVVLVMRRPLLNDRIGVALSDVSLELKNPTLVQVFPPAPAFLLVELKNRPDHVPACSARWLRLCRRPCRARGLRWHGAVGAGRAVFLALGA